MSIEFEETEYGFKYGSADLSRLCSDVKKGWVMMGLKTPKTDIQIYVTKTGKVRVFDIKNGELKSKNKWT